MRTRIIPARLLNRGTLSSCRWVLFSVIAALLGYAPVHASERLVWRFDQRHGLRVADIRALAQDTEGFLWIGTVAGLARFDGNIVAPWADDVIAEEVNLLASGPRGAVLAGTASGRIYRVAGDGVELLSGPGGVPLTGVADAVFGDDGQLWIARGEDVLVRTGAGRWLPYAAHAFGGEAVRRLAIATNGTIYAGTTGGVWQVGDDGDATRLLRAWPVTALLVAPDGGLHVLTFGGELVELRDGRTRRRFQLPGRGIDLIQRGSSIWASVDRYLVSVAPNAAPAMLGPAEGFPGGGPLLVDHEGGLWAGGFTGLLYYPEPLTLVLNEKDGLPSAHARFLTRTDEAVWVSTWQGLGRVVPSQNGWRAHDEQISFVGRPCLDSEGKLWAADGSHLMRRVDGRWDRTARVPGLPGTYFQNCAPSAYGLWVVAGNRLYLSAAPGRPQAIDIPGANGDAAAVDQVLEDRGGRVWTASGGRICSTTSRDVARAGNASWMCDELPGVREVSRILEDANGRLWLGTKTEGVFRRDEQGWRQVEGSRALPSRDVHGLRVAAAGGIWVYGTGFILRVVDRPAYPDGWAVLERLSSWHGLIERGASDVLEDDGGIWVTSAAGVTRVPREVRDQPAPPPRIAISSVIANGEVNDSADGLRLPHGQNSLRLLIAALSYRDRSLLRYQMRLRAGEPWIESSGAPPNLQFANLAPGEYNLEVRASLDGDVWSPRPATLAVIVPFAWYQHWWGVSLLALAAAVPLYVVHRARVAVTKRLEQQRTEIALDLHDEMGSGLGSIGILSEVIAGDQVPDAERRQLGQKIARAAGELGTALTDIVWSLRTEARSLERVAYYLAERGGQLCAGGRPAFVTQFPEAWPAVDLSAPVRHHLLLLGLEALHNAARHSGASTLVLRIAPEGRRWRLEIADDGAGLPESAVERRTGMGLSGMQRRAGAIGAEIRVMSSKDAGTVVTIAFDPRTRRGPRRLFSERARVESSHDHATGAGGSSREQSRATTRSTR